MIEKSDNNTTFVYIDIAQFTDFYFNFFVKVGGVSQCQCVQYNVSMVSSMYVLETQTIYNVEY